MPPIPSTYTRRKEHKFDNDIELKHCGKCDSWKTLVNFNKLKSSWDGLRHQCKDCVKAQKTAINDACGYYTDQAKAKWQETKNCEERKEKKREYRGQNKEKLHMQFKQWYEKNKVEHNKKTYQNRINDPKHIEYMKSYRPKYEKKRRETDPQFKLKSNYSRRIREMLTMANTSGKIYSSSKYLGCDIKYFMTHLETQFTDEMTWDNQGEWHLDHIIPCSSFDLTNDFEIFACFNYRNYQPLMGIDNIIKSDTYDIQDRDAYLQIMRPIYGKSTKK